MSTLNGLQFDQERLDTALAVPARTRRLAASVGRREAAQRNATQWALQVTHSSHDDLKRGETDVRQSHVLLSKDEYPEPMEAEKIAYLLSKGYPTRVRHV